MSVKTIMPICDAMVIGAHPDDAELCCGGTIAKLTKEGKNVVLVDLTRGEMGTRGNPELRAQEAKLAAEILGVKERVNLSMRDGYINDSPEALIELITVIRKYRPKMIITHPHFERHPDHEASHKLVRNALFKSGLAKIHTEENGVAQNTFRTRKIYCFMQSYQFDRKPDFYVDISDVHDIKLDAVKAFSSQVFVPGYEGVEEKPTRLSSPEFMEELIARSRYFGGVIGTSYAEAFLSVEPLGLNSLSRLID